MTMRVGIPLSAAIVLWCLLNLLLLGAALAEWIPWDRAGPVAVLLSVLFWLPLVWGLRRAIAQVTRVTEQVAEGKFDVRVKGTRGDEIGRLGQAVNRMAERLSGFVGGQKRFLGDVAHELCSPLARMEVALGILEERADEAGRAGVADVREEVRQMSSIVNELLSFSKAGLREQSIRIKPVELAGLVRAIVERDAKSAEVQVEVPAGLRALAEPGLLARALSNLLRNAIRYAGRSGPVAIFAAIENDRVVLSVADSGPGVPEEALSRIFDPFFRLQSSRERDTGGVGLGLAIVKSCVEGCQGSLSVKNRRPRGLQVDLRLLRAP